MSYVPLTSVENAKQAFRDSEPLDRLVFSWNAAMVEEALGV